MEILISLSRYILPALGAVIVFRCAVSMLSGRADSEVWGTLTLPGGRREELRNWENIVGRSGASDVVLDGKSVSGTHGALIRDAGGNWTVHDLHSKKGVKVRGKAVSGPTAIRTGDTVTFGGVTTVFTAATASDQRERAKSRRRPGARVSPSLTLMLLTLFTALLGLSYCASDWEDLNNAVPMAFLILIGLMWAVYAVTRSLRRTGFELETLAFFLTSVGFGVCASSAPGEIVKELVCLAAGVVLYFLIGVSLRDLALVKKLRFPMAAAGLALLAFNLLTAGSIFGAKNWIQIGGVTFQPSELVKICFVFSGAATLDRLFAKRNLLGFLLFSAATVGCLAAMSDFGTAAVFFVCYIVIAFMRSGSFATVLLSLGGTGFAAFIAVTARPYILQRFATWGHAWDAPNAGGYQQTRTMAAAASGGLFGLGAGKGRLHYIFAADTDMVFGVVAEELGLILAVLCVTALIVVALFAVKSAGGARSSFYAIAACASVTILLTQLILNVFGSLDILPFTGVTFPLVSRGGTSLIATWGLLAFVKAADARQNASFAIRLPKKEKKKSGGEDG